MKNKYELMGQFVSVKSYMKPTKAFNKRSYQKHNLKTERVGMVVGYRTVYEGKKIQQGNYNPEDFEPSYLTEIKSIKVVLVCFWPTYKPVLVLPEDIKKVEYSEEFFFFTCGVGWLPRKDLYHPTSLPYSERDKEDLRMYAAEMKRDSKGRWIK